MGAARRNLAVCRALAGLVALGLLAAPWVHAAAAEESIDDPKLARRLGTRIDWVSPPVPPVPVPVPPTPGAWPGASAAATSVAPGAPPATPPGAPPATPPGAPPAAPPGA